MRGACTAEIEASMGLRAWKTEVCVCACAPYMHVHETHGVHVPVYLSVCGHCVLYICFIKTTGNRVCWEGK